VGTERAGELHERAEGHDRRAASARFTLAIVLSTVAVLVAWMWFAIVVEDTWGDECKARAAGQSGVTFLIAFGVVPLLLVTAGAVAALIGFAPGVRGGKVWRGLVAAIVITAAGVLLAWWATDGMLLAHLALGSGCLA
jgi:uncharacterized BrkB/YihY/UPF0761 family membrane protein